MKLQHQVSEILDDARSRLLKLARKQHRTTQMVDRALVGVIELRSSVVRGKRL